MEQIIAHSFADASFLTAYLSVNKFYIVYLSEMFLNFQFQYADDNFQISGDSIAKISHPSDTKSGGEFAY